MLGQCKDGCGLCTDSSSNRVRVKGGGGGGQGLPALFRVPCFLERTCVHASLLGENIVTGVQSLGPARLPSPPPSPRPTPLQICKGNFLVLHGVFLRPARECVFLVNMLETTSR